MFGRLVEVEGVDPAAREEVGGIMREQIIPRLKEREGFVGFISLMDPDNKRGRTVILWETQEAAEAAEREFAPRREELVRKHGGTVQSADLYEAPIVEVQTAVHA